MGDQNFSATILDPSKIENVVKRMFLNRRSLYLVGMLGFILLGTSLYLNSGATNASGIPYLNAERVASGKQVYEQNCASCHGVNLGGQVNWQKRDAAGYLPAPPHNETGHTWHHDDQMLFEMTKYGPQKFAGSDYKSIMPAYANKLNDDQIWDVLAFIKSKWPEQIQNRHTRAFRDKKG